MPCLGYPRTRHSNICSGFYHASQTAWRRCSARYWRKIGRFMYETERCPWLERSQRSVAVDPPPSLACVHDRCTSDSRSWILRNTESTTKTGPRLDSIEGHAARLMSVQRGMLIANSKLAVPSPKPGSQIEDDAALPTHEQTSCTFNTSPKLTPARSEQDVWQLTHVMRRSWQCI